MGSSKDTMELFAERDIGQVFTRHDGWKVTPVSPAHAAGCCYRAIRSRWPREEVAYVAVSFDKTPSEGLISSLDTLATGQGKNTKKYLLTPLAANTRAVPPHVKLLQMQSFTFEGNDLVWLTKKKNARKFPPAPAPSVS